MMLESLDSQYPTLADYYSDHAFGFKKIEYTRLAWLKEVGSQFENLCGFNVYNAIIQSVSYNYPKSLTLHFRSNDLILSSRNKIYFWDGEVLSDLIQEDTIKIRDCFFEGLQSTETPNGDHVRLTIKNKLTTYRIIVEDCEEATLQRR